MANLIPEVRTDKNGKQTTRWVKPAWAAVSATNVPAVRLQSAAIHKKLVGLLTDKGRPVREGLVEAVSVGVSTEQAKQLVELLSAERSGSEQRELKRWITICVENPDHGKFLLEKIIAHEDNDASVKVPKSILMGLYFYEQDMSFEQEAALLKITDAASYVNGLVTFKEIEFPFESYALRSNELADLVLELPEQADEISGIVRERETDDTVLIREILTSGTHNSLSRGTL